MKAYVHQYTVTIEPGDGVSNSVFMIQRLLLEMGIDSNIYSDRIHPDLTDRVIPHTDYRDTGHGVLIVHHAIAQPDPGWIEGLLDERVLIYHNITPAHFFVDSSLHGQGDCPGRSQIARWARLFAGTIAVSEYNAGELRLLGYENIHTIPLVVDLKRSVVPDREIILKHEGTFNFIFVGRIVENKCQHDLIHAFADLDRDNTRLFLVGGVTSHDYRNYLTTLVDHYNLQDRVIFTGRVSDQALWGYYRAADVFVCLSDHEGFCIPLVEATLAGLPVVAYDSSNVKNTLGGSGLLLSHKNSRHVSKVWQGLMEQPEWRYRLVSSQRDTLVRFAPGVLKAGLSAFLSTLGIKTSCPQPAPEQQKTSPSGQVSTLRIEGPFDSFYSLAMVNSNLALAFKRMGLDTGLFSTEGGGDYNPDERFLTAYPRFKALWQPSLDPPLADLVIRNLYPPRVTRMNGRRKILGPYGWEESAFPGTWAEDFNRNLHLITTMSRFVTKTLQDNGVTVPVKTVGIGVDHLKEVPEEPLGFDLPQGYTLLHVSSGFPRKGPDLLIAAFSQAYGEDFKAVLIIKTFPNPHNTIQRDLLLAGWHPVSEYTYQSPAHGGKTILLLNQELTPGQMVFLYRHSDLLIAPGRGEGFGLPMAEAMVFNLPVLTTAMGGQADFCTPETAWLIKADFARARTHMGFSDSVWMEPRLDDLVKKMNRMTVLSDLDKARKTGPARKNILEQYTWDRVAQRIMGAVDVLGDRVVPVKPLRTGWVTTWNIPCGIASYSGMLISSFPEKYPCILANYTSETLGSGLEPGPDHVIRCWQAGGNDNLEQLRDTILGQGLTDVVVQFNFSFFNLEALTELVAALDQRGVRVYMFLHSTRDVKPPHEPRSLATMGRALSLCRRVFVHSINDLNNLKEKGIFHNTTLFPHGVKVLPAGPPCSASGETGQVLAAFGFLLPHKGTWELIQAFEIVRKTRTDVKLLLLTALYPGGASEDEYSRCRTRIDKSPFREDITLVTDYLEEQTVNDRLTRADLIVYPYQHTQESSSAAVRTGLATGRPVATTCLEIFDDVADVVYTLPGRSPAALAEGIAELLADPALKERLAANQQAWLDSHSWERLGPRLGNIMVANAAKYPGPDPGAPDLSANGRPV